MKLKYCGNKSLAMFKHYINDCFNLKRYNRNSNKDKYQYPYVSICLPAYNMEKYIEKVILSILNQIFQNFEIIIVNDYSIDNTKNIIKRLQLKDKRIKLINHSKNLGVYTSRVDAIFSSKGKYIILMDPDDMLINPKLLQKLYKFNQKYNVDIIEYTVIRYNENQKILYCKRDKVHFHDFSKIIISQPELSNINYYFPNTKNYSKVLCRNIWNKIIRREVLLKAINYIGKDYYQKFFITAEDTIINLICFNFAQNYSNQNLPGYMYNIRKKSMTHGKKNKKNQILFYYNHFLYLKKLFIYIKDFNKDRDFLYYELIEINRQFFRLNKISNNFRPKLLDFYNQILNDKYISKKFKKNLKEIFPLIIYKNYKIKMIK